MDKKPKYFSFSLLRMFFSCTSNSWLFPFWSEFEFVKLVTDKNEHHWGFTFLTTGGISRADCMWTREVDSSWFKLQKYEIFCFFSFSSFTIDLKYVYMLDVLIYHSVYMKYFDYTLPALKNFEKAIWAQKTWMNFNQLFWHKLFL